MTGTGFTGVIEEDITQVLRKQFPNYFDIKRVNALIAACTLVQMTCWKYIIRIETVKITAGII